MDFWIFGQTQISRFSRLFQKCPVVWSGTITGLMEGEVQSAYSGDVKGVKSGDVLKVETTFTIEGSTVVELQKYQIKDNELLKKQGTLHEVNGKLELQAGATFGKSYKKGPCQ